MLNNNKKKAWIKGSAFSSVVLAASLLTACGGGGSSDGGSAPTIEITYPEASTAITLKSIEPFTIKATNCTGLKVFLGPVDDAQDISEPFVKSCVDGNASAPFAEVKHYLKDGANELRASIKGSGTPSVTFNANMIDDSVFVTSIKKQGVENKEVVFPSYGDEIELKGVTRNAEFGESDLSLVGDLNVSVFSYTKNDKVFTLDTTLPGVSVNDTQPDVTMTAYGKHTTHYAVNGKQFSTIAGLQINDGAFDSLKPWLGTIASTLVTQYLANNTDVLGLSENQEICAALPPGIGANTCGLNFKGLTKDGDKPAELRVDKLEVDSTTDLIGKGEGFVLRAVLSLDNHVVDIDIPVNNESEIVSAGLVLDSGAAIEAQLIVKKEGDGLKVYFPDNTGGEKFALQFSGRVDAVNNPDCTPKVEGVCSKLDDLEKLGDTLKSGLNSNDRLSKEVSKALEDFLDDNGYKKGDEIVSYREGLTFSSADMTSYTTTNYNDISEHDYDCHAYFSVESEEDIETSKDKGLVCSRQSLASDKVITTNEGSGLIALGGGVTVIATKNMKENEVIRSSIGSIMDPTELALADDDHELSTGSGIALAVSENMLNQRLMASYLSGELASYATDLSAEDCASIPPKDACAVEVRKIKGITTDIATGNGLKPSVKIAFDIHFTNDITVESLPSIALESKLNAVRLDAPNVKVIINYVDMQNVLLDGMTPDAFKQKWGVDPNSLIEDMKNKLEDDSIIGNVILDLNALAKLNVNNKGQPVTTVDKEQLSYYIADVNVSSQLEALNITADKVKPMIGKELSVMLADQLGTYGNAILKGLGTVDVDVEKYLASDCDESSVENCTENLVNKSLRAELPRYFTFNLSEGGINIDHDNAIYFNGNLAESSGTDDALFTMKFCSSSDFVKKDDGGKLELTDKSCIIPNNK